MEQYKNTIKLSTLLLQALCKLFGSCDWSVIAIVAQDNSSYARLHFNAGPGGDIKIPVCVAYGCEFDASDFRAWQQQYLANVFQDTILALPDKSKKSKLAKEEEIGVFGNTELAEMPASSPEDILEELEQMHPADRQEFMNELAIRSDFWDETEVFYD